MALAVLLALAPTAVRAQIDRNLDHYVIFALEELDYKGGNLAGTGYVLGGHVGVNRPDPNLGDNTILMSVGANGLFYMSDGTQLVGGSIRLGEEASVWDVYVDPSGKSGSGWGATNPKTGGPTVRNSENAIANSTDLPIIATSDLTVANLCGPFAAVGASNVTVPQNTTQTLAPGAYKVVTVQDGATLNLQAGVYTLERFHTGQNTTVHTVPGTVLHIWGDNDASTNEFNLGGNGSYFGPVDPSTEAIATICVADRFPNNTLNTKNHVGFSDLGEFHGVIYAPQAGLNFGRHFDHYGRFVSRTVGSDFNTNVNYVPPTARIKVDKVVPGGDPQSFPFTLVGGPSQLNEAFSLTSAATPFDSGDVLPGAGYAVTETVPAGWALLSATCDNGDPPGSITATAGSTVTCTFVNVKDTTRIKIDKVTLPAADPQSFSFTLKGGPSALNQAFGLTDAAAPHDSGTILSGAGYVAAETLPAGWVLTSAVCDNGSAPSDIAVNPGQTVTCTFTNTKLGRILIDKVVPGGDPQSFGFTLKGGPSALNQAFALTDAAAPHDSGLVVPGSGYAAAETIPAGWTQTGASCSNGSAVNNVTVNPGETVTCTFTNEKAPAGTGTLRVDKVTSPAADPQSFGFSLTGGPSGLNQTFSLTDTAAPFAISVTPGAGYNVAETLPAGWTETGAACDNGSPVSNITVSAGQTVTCTFTNTKSAAGAGKIKVDKITIPAADPQVFSFTLTGGPVNINQAFVLTDTSPASQSSVTPGSGYAVAETVPAGWAQIGASCSNGSPLGNVSVNAGQTVTCTVVNQKLGDFPLLLISSTATLSFKKKGVADDQLAEVFTMIVNAGDTISPPTEAVTVALSEPGCGGTFSSLSIPIGGFRVVGTAPAASYYFRGNVVDALTGALVNTSVRLTAMALQTYRVSLDLKTANFACLAGTGPRTITTELTIGNTSKAGGACFQRYSNGDLYWPPQPGKGC
jgi:hypothetical protein